jgi:hypothetical protein
MICRAIGFGVIGHDAGRRRKHIVAMLATTIQGTTTGSLTRLATAAGLSPAGGDVKTWSIVAVNGHRDALQMLSLYRLCHHLVCSYLLLPPINKEENREQLHRRRAGMSMSTAPRDLAAIKHALELGLILATLIIATIMIVTAAHDDARKLTPDITIGQVMFGPV